MQHLGENGNSFGIVTILLAGKPDNWGQILDKTISKFKVIHITGSRSTTQYLIQLLTRVTKYNFYYFVVFILQISDPIDHLQAGNSQKYTFVLNAVKDVNI